MTKLVDSERAARLMAAKGIDILVGTGYINFGYLSGYFTHFGRDYPGPLVNGAPLVRFAGLPRDQRLAPFLITYPGEEGDLFRVYALGEPPADAVRIHQSLDQVNALMIEAVEPGIAAADLYHLGTEAMKERGLEMALDFVGHGIGLDVHELPNLVATDVTVLQENMVIVLELATRRFDLGHFSAEVPLLVTRQGCEVLTELPYALTVIGS